MIAIIFAIAGRIFAPACAGLEGARWATCVEVVAAAHVEGAPLDLAVALAWNESGMRRDVVSSAGAVGPLQVVPRWACPGGRVEGCDLARAGARVLRVHLDRNTSPAAAVCHYAAGNTCNRRAARYGRHVARTARAMARGVRPWTVAP